MDLNALFESLAIFFTSTYFGGITYQCIVENPARLSCNPKALLDEWVGSLNMCQKYFPILLLPSVIFSSILYIQRGTYLWIVAALLVFLIFPLTGIFLISKYNKLSEIQSRKLDEKNEAEVNDVRRTIIVVGYFHMFKAVLSGSALIISLYLFKHVHEVVQAAAPAAIPVKI